ncbi:MAG TPA: hypothetical protein VFK02_30075 [Kofleriaceae bacterium]|nr:hypothetical protein [Kofleriaceae bacterium]
MRIWLLTLLVCACSKDAPAPSPVPRETPRPQDTSSGANAPGRDPPAVGPATARAEPAPSLAAAAAAPVPAAHAYPDLGAALVATVPADARVVGFGELHARTDRPVTTSSLARFTRALPAIAARISDLVLETWRIDPACGNTAVQTTTRLETVMKRPETTKSEIAQLVDAARAAHIQPHAMTLTCADYAAIGPAGGDVDPTAMLTLTTRELTRIATSAVRHRDREPRHRPWIALYGGALHNDRFPDPGVAEWSYAAAVDLAAGGRFVEIDLIVPELAADDRVMQREPWFPLVGAPRDPARPVVVWTRGERSFVVILPPSDLRSSAPAAAPSTEPPPARNDPAAPPAPSTEPPPARNDPAAPPAPTAPHPMPAAPPARSKGAGRHPPPSQP